MVRILEDRNEEQSYFIESLEMIKIQIVDFHMLDPIK